jgi:hypothetical protein
MKRIGSNIEMMNKKYASIKQQQPVSPLSVGRDSINDDSIQSRNRSVKSNSTMREPMNELTLRNEVCQLQNDLKSMHEEFALKRKQLEEECSDEVKQINENVTKNQSLQRDLESGKHTMDSSFDLYRRFLRAYFGYSSAVWNRKVIEFLVETRYHPIKVM